MHSNERGRWGVPTGTCAIALAGWMSAVGAAQQAAPETPVPLIQFPDMLVINTSLGVTCEYCHAGPGRDPIMTANGKPRLAVAREMIVMTSELNVRVQTAVGKTEADSVRITCMTCHRGLAIPRPLQDIVWQTTRQQSVEAAVKQYRELRAQYYGKPSYDFGEETLIVVAERLASTRPAAAITLMQLNLEFYPRSSRTYVVLGIAQRRQSDFTHAIASLEKAIELDPSNGIARGWLSQVQDDFESRQRIR